MVPTNITLMMNELSLLDIKEQTKQSEIKCLLHLLKKILKIVKNNLNKTFVVLFQEIEIAAEQTQ